MVAAYHLIWSAYGCWLPNDPRGSSSSEIRVPEIAALGEIYYGRKQIQPARRTLRDFYAEADRVLKHPRLLLGEEEVQIVAMSLQRTVTDQRYTCYACAIMPDHVHLLIRKHKHAAEQMLDRFQEDGKQALINGGKRSPDHPIWGGPGWKVYLDTEDQIRWVIEYIRQNPIRAGRAAQEYGFVQQYDGWLPGGRRNK